MPEVQVVLLGAGAVGKSCISVQYVQGYFVDQYDATIEDVYRKPVEIDGRHVILGIVDTAGQDSFGTQRDGFMASGQAFLFVYSVTDPDSFQQAKRLYAQTRRVRGGEAVAMPPCIVVGNKVDLADRQRAVPRDDGEMFARQVGAAFREVTAKSRDDVNELFEFLVRGVLGVASSPSQQPSSAAASEPSRSEERPRPPPVKPPAGNGRKVKDGVKDKGCCK